MKGGGGFYDKTQFVTWIESYKLYQYEQIQTSILQRFTLFVPSKHCPTFYLIYLTNKNINFFITIHICRNHRTQMHTVPANFLSESREIYYLINQFLDDFFSFIHQFLSYPKILPFIYSFKIQQAFELLYFTPLEISYSNNKLNFRRLQNFAKILQLLLEIIQ
ncbi:unnamed protein product [Paramecium octaurelia]|uniref:Uncharacterized protein n=1 Tax=Paramecium octaurelia TaxID=43137 RepID=A0A8S1YKA7_PAROT|nr:unnamed protein product [Paramecium octaurelia]